MELFTIFIFVYKSVKELVQDAGLSKKKINILYQKVFKIEKRTTELEKIKSELSDVEKDKEKYANLTVEIYSLMISTIFYLPPSKRKALIEEKIRNTDLKNYLLKYVEDKSNVFFGPSSLWDILMIQQELDFTKSTSLQGDQK